MMVYQYFFNYLLFHLLWAKLVLTIMFWLVQQLSRVLPAKAEAAWEWALK